MFFNILFASANAQSKRHPFPDALKQQRFNYLFYLATKNMAANSTPIIQVPMFISFILPVNIFTKI